MNPMTWTILLTTLSISTIITMSSHQWLLAWLGLELNTMSMLPIIMKPHHPRATEAATKYFLIQATAAALILFAGTLNTWVTGQWFISHFSSTWANIIMTAAIMLKLGLAPAHMWYPEVLQGSTLHTALIMSTWQKLAPLTLLYLTMNHLPTNILITMGLMSALIGGWAGLNQTQTRKIIAFSSIAHMGWLLIALNLNPHLATLTLTMYLMMTSTIFVCLYTTTTKTVSDVGTAWLHSPPLLMIMTLTLLSLGGLPPLTGFIPKWLILKELTMMGLGLLSIMMALATLPSLYFYLRMTYLATLHTPTTTTNAEYKWRFKPNYKINLTPITTLSTMMFPLTPLLYNLL
uniref:NADH-ubiquinone oxidoreductase chain 2 n=1 Tax=Goggia microlepidota TaxID=2231126 RepID=A0A2Z4EGE8_9SAUR|nr:NADH dehydrogenase subunit 2 [Goggia microlepidota]